MHPSGPPSPCHACQPKRCSQITQGKRHPQRLGADPGREILLLWCRDVFGHRNMLDVGKGELSACSKPQLKVGMAGCMLEMAEAEPSSVHSSGARLKEEQKISSLLYNLRVFLPFLVLGSSNTACSCRKAALLLLSTDSRQESSSCKGSKQKRSGLTEHPLEEEQVFCPQIKDMACYG